MVERVETDVCVVGAGYAGLTAGLRLSQHGRAVVVLEARDRVGGRVWTDALADGTPIDRGGGWFAPYHDRAFALAGEFGVATHRTWVQGKHLLVDGDRVRRYTGLIPKISPLAVGSIALAQFRIDRLSKQVPIDAPWKAARAAEWDARPLGSFMDRCGIRRGIGRDLFEMAVRGLFPADFDDVSFLDLLMLVRGHHSINALFSIEKGAQENLVDGGAGSIAQHVASRLGDGLRLRSPVRSIAQRDDRVIVSSDALTVTAKHAVVAIPPVLATEIAFDPVLPDDRMSLYRVAVAGSEAKTLVVYDEPFWRGAGFSGQTAQPGSVAEVTLDASPMSGKPGIIASFTFGPIADRAHAMDPADRRRAVIDALVTRLGPRAAAPVDFVETAWWTEEWTRGCSMAHFPPGALTRWGHLLQEPFGRVHWAGTETSFVSHGAIDGAIRSGERAAAEILDGVAREFLPAV